VDERIQLDPGRLDQAIQQDLEAGHKPFAIVATAGTTSAGAIDDLPELAKIARRHGLWLHVDGAYGAAALFSDQHRGLMRGIELADSVTLDPHKWMAMPFSAGAILTSHPEMLRQTFSIATPYMPRARSSPLLDNFQISAQWSRRMNSLKLWLTLKVHGRQAYEELIDRQLRLARSFAGWIKASSEFELAAPQVLPIVTFRLKSKGRSEAEITAAHTPLLERMTADGSRWISGTHVAGRSVLRMMVISYLTEERHLQALQAALRQAAK
jgi:glutamate/tyrosine decarboxylase-like PLP-dependent enzyme